MISRHFSIFADAQAFLSAAGPMLYAHETVNNLILGVSERLVNNPNTYDHPFFSAVSGSDGKIILAAVMTPPHNLILAGGIGVEECFPILIDHLKTYPIKIPGVVAPVEIAEGFSQAWKGLTGAEFEVTMRMRVYELRQVRLSSAPDGVFMKAAPCDIPTIAKWMQVFEQEALGKNHDLDPDRAEKLVTGGYVYTWVVADEVVSMATKARPIAHSITVGGVYTPPEHRRHGYAGALVANLSQLLLDEGYQFVNLFTDLDNPTSNKIYQEVGYQPVCDFRAYRFTQPAE